MEKRGPVIFMQKGEPIIVLIPLRKRGAKHFIPPLEKGGEGGF